MKIAVISAESTGTHFARHAVDQMTGARPWRTNKFRDGDRAWCHAYAPDTPGITEDRPAGLLVAADVVVVPMRHPERALATNAAAGHHSVSPRDHMRALNRVLGWGVCFLPIDSPRSEEYAEMLRARLGGRAIKDWTPRNSCGREAQPDLSALEVLTDDSLRVLAELGYN